MITVTLMTLALYTMALILPKNIIHLLIGIYGDTLVQKLLTGQYIPFPFDD